MCGITGVIGMKGQPVDAHVVQRMGDSLIHRGPDGEGVEALRQDVVFGHRRLAIIDIEGGHQPMSNEDESIWITFNGEIFNYESLRGELKSRGHRFRTQSDTEVIIHLYEEYGEGCLDRLRGQFAFAIWDGEQVFCARDPIGIKPFYYYMDRNWFAFASEPRAFFTVPDLDLEIDPHAVRLFLRYHYVPAPFTGYKNVHKLRAGEFIRFKPGQEPRPRRYWDLASMDEPLITDLEAGRDELREHIERAVSSQMMADVPISAFLSGGIDSSSVVAAMQQSCADPIRTFTVGFPEKDERGDAQEVADHVGTEHQSILSEPSSVESLLSQLLDDIDEPLGDTSIIPTYLVSALAQENAKVALSGDGGDELFAGYGRHVQTVNYLSAPFYERPLWRVLAKRRGSKGKAADWSGIDSRQFSGWENQIHSRLSDSREDWLVGPALKEVAGREYLDPIRAEISHYRELPPLAQVLAIDIQTNLADRLLAKVDRASMRASLEVRVPLLDLDLVRFAFRLAPELQFFSGQSKGLVREAMKNALPKSVFERKKQGFGPPLKHWFAQALAPQVLDRLTNSVAVQEGLLNPRSLAVMLRPGRHGKVNGPALWRALVLDGWLRGLADGRLRASG